MKSGHEATLQVTTGSLRPCRPADNPFASHRVDALAYRPQGTTWDELLEGLARLQWRAAIVGPEGSGKTTLLESLASRIDGSVLVRLGGSRASTFAAALSQLPRPFTTRHTVFIDAAERLAWPDWRRLRHVVRHGRGLVATLHTSGRLPTLVRCAASSALLLDLVHELAPGEARRLEAILDDLFVRHGGNLRNCFQELYDVYAGRRADVEKRLGCRCSLETAGSTLQSGPLR